MAGISLLSLITDHRSLVCKQIGVMERSTAQIDLGLCRRFRLLRHIHRAARLLPAAKAAPDMGDRLEAHALGGLRGKRGAPAARTEEHELLVLREHRLVVRALRVDPELEHAARAVEGTRHPALAVEFADVAQVDEHDVVVAVELERVFDRQVFDLTLGGIDERAKSHLDLLRHGSGLPLPMLGAAGRQSRRSQAAARPLSREATARYRRRGRRKPHRHKYRTSSPRASRRYLSRFLAWFPRGANHAPSHLNVPRGS